jgi:hypothetical protein
MTVNVASSSVTLSPSLMGVFGKTRFCGHSSPNIGPMIWSLLASSAVMVSITPWGAMIGTSYPATSNRLRRSDRDVSR